MDWYPLYNSVRIALFSTAVIFFLGIAAAYYVARLPRALKGVLDAVLTLPLVLPPTVVGFLLLRVLGPRRPFGAWVIEHWGVKLTMTWYSAIFVTAVVIFPLLYRTARGARSAARMRGCSGACGCRAAVRAFSPEPCSRSRVRSANTARRA